MVGSTSIPGPSNLCHQVFLHLPHLKLNYIQYFGLDGIVVWLTLRFLLLTLLSHPPRYDDNPLLRNGPDAFHNQYNAEKP